LRDQNFFDQYGIERRHEKAAMIDVPNRSLQLASGEILEPDSVLIATGGVPQQLETAGVWLDGVHTLRTWEDSERIIRSAKGKRRAVVVGASFIAMETAAALRERDLEVTVIAPEDKPFSDVLGPEIADFIRQLHEKHGVQFKLGRTVRRFLGNQRLQSIELDDESSIDADMVVVGIGIRPATGVVKGASLNPDGSVDVDSRLRVDAGVYAAGDIARYPDPWLEEPVRIEHWRLAQQQGRVAAENMLGHDVAFRKVPFFWTRHYDVSIGYAGFAPKWDRTILAGSIEDQQFTVYFNLNGQIVAAAGTDVNELTAFSELRQRDRLPDPDQLTTADSHQLLQMLQGEHVTTASHHSPG
ncbi:MAG: NAD(P)/FAD-dependent oxidoreductase, partial [Planctomycetota bacterium]